MPEPRSVALGRGGHRELGSDPHDRAAPEQRDACRALALLWAPACSPRRRWRAPASPRPSRSAFRKPSPRSRQTSTGCTTTSTSSSSSSPPSCMVLLLYVMWRFSESRNPTPSRTTHNTTIEVLWTVIPVLILVAIAIPSFKLLYFQYTFPPPDLTIKATAHAWNWTHEYPDQGITRRFADAAGRRARGRSSRPAYRPGRCRATWRSTTRSWCPSTRWCTCSSPPAT